MDKITFTGNWTEEDKELIMQACKRNFDDIIECIYDPRPCVVPYRAIVTQRGRTQRPVAYGAEALAENIKNCF